MHATGGKVANFGSEMRYEPDSGIGGKVGCRKILSRTKARGIPLDTLRNRRIDSMPFCNWRSLTSAISGGAQSTRRLLIETHPRRFLSLQAA